MTAARDRVETQVLLGHLMKAVRPEFRGDVFHPPVDSPVFFYGVCRIPACPTAVAHGALELCSRHYQAWGRSGRGELEAWVAEQDARVWATLAACGIQGCNRARKSGGLCRRHHEQWKGRGSPELAGWIDETRYVPPRSPDREETCCAPECGRWTEGPTRSLCRGHDEMWRRMGKPELTGWLTDLAYGENPRIRFDGIAPHLRLELQFGLQCRHDDAVKLTPVRSLVPAVRIAREAGVDSLLDLSVAEWRERLGGRRLQAFSSMARTFLLDTRFRLVALLIEDDPWADQFDRDTWDLRLLGIQDANIRHLRFGDIRQRWLSELVKRWCRWELARGLSPPTVALYLQGCRSLASFLAMQGDVTGPSDLNRSHLEAWMADRVAGLGPSLRAATMSGVRCFFRDVHRHEWEPDLPRTVMLFGDDMPVRRSSNPRWIDEHVMRQMESPANLAQFPSDAGRLVLRILMECGLRLKDTRTLPFGCVTRDDAGAPYLAWLNRKMADRPAFFPISEALAGVVTEQQSRVRMQFPTGCQWLFPAANANLDGSKPIGGGGFTKQLDQWLERIDLTDAAGARVRVTAHQFRHTVGTRLINRNVPQHVVQQLLDHMSSDMTAIYARLHNRTVRDHWERATKVNAVGEPVVLDPDHPLADAAWTRLTLVRAKVTLPNGYCGAPVQTDCEYANPCLDCHFFITTVDFLGQHRRQREDTRRMIDEGQQAGLVRIVEKNTRTLQNLDRIIDTLETAEPDGLIVGGEAPADAAG